MGVSRARDDRFREQEITGNARRPKVSVSRRRNTSFRKAIITSWQIFTQLGAEAARTLAKAWQILARPLFLTFDLPARRRREAPGGARRRQEAPGGARTRQEAPGGARKRQEAPGGTRRRQEAPGGDVENEKIRVYPDAGVRFARPRSARRRCRKQKV